MNIGIIGYSTGTFDKAYAEQALRTVLSPMKDAKVVSGLTNIGVPAIAYKVASELGFKTMGIACSLAQDYECYPCDEVIIVGDNWGDESATFLGSIDVLYKVGGGEQSKREYAMFTGEKYEL